MTADVRVGDDGCTVRESPVTDGLAGRGIPPVLELGMGEPVPLPFKRAAADDKAKESGLVSPLPELGIRLSLSSNCVFSFAGNEPTSDHIFSPMRTYPSLHQGRQIEFCRIKHRSHLRTLRADLRT